MICLRNTWWPRGAAQAVAAAVIKLFADADCVGAEGWHMTTLRDTPLVHAGHIVPATHRPAADGEPVVRGGRGCVGTGSSSSGCEECRCGPITRPAVHIELRILLHEKYQ